MLIYAVGLPWLYVSLSNLHVPNPLQATLTGGLYPFLIGDAPQGDLRGRFAAARVAAGRA